MPGSRSRARHRPTRRSKASAADRNWGLILFALFGATAPEGVVWYTGQFYALFYMTTVLKMNYVTVFVIMMIALSAAAPFFIVFGALSDRVGRRNIMTIGFGLAVITFWPVFTWLGTFKDNPVILTILVFYLVILVTMVYGPIAAFLVELFPARIRYTSMSLPYHVGNGVFGGLVPAAGASIAALTGIALGRVVVSDGDRGGRGRRQPRFPARAVSPCEDLGRGRRPAAGSRPALSAGAYLAGGAKNAGASGRARMLSIKKPGRSPDGSAGGSIRVHSRQSTSTIAGAAAGHLGRAAAPGCGEPGRHLGDFRGAEPRIAVGILPAFPARAAEFAGEIEALDMVGRGAVWPRRNARKSGSSA